MPKAAKSYGVRLVRGPFVSVEPHPDAVNDAALLAERDRESQLWAADLFCGCGGISLGFLEAGIPRSLGSITMRRHWRHGPQTFPVTPAWRIFKTRFRSTSLSTFWQQ